MKEWINKSINQWISKSVNQWTNDWTMNQWVVDESMIQWTNDSSTTHRSDSMNQWDTWNRWINESLVKNDSMKECVNASVTRWINKYVKATKNETEKIVSGKTSQTKPTKTEVKTKNKLFYLKQYFLFQNMFLSAFTTIIAPVSWFQQTYCHVILTCVVCCCSSSCKSASESSLIRVLL
jgi:hypothetical protein